METLGVLAANKIQTLELFGNRFRSFVGSKGIQPNGKTIDSPIPLSGTAQAVFGKRTIPWLSRTHLGWTRGQALGPFERTRMRIHS